jgi:hypothetical protein
VVSKQTLLPGDIVQIPEGDYAWVHKIVGKRGMVIEELKPGAEEPGRILIEGALYDLYVSEVVRISDG